MRRRIPIVLALWPLLATLSAQVRPVAALPALAQALAAQVNGAGTLTDVTLAGTVQFLNVTHPGTGAVTLVATASGASEAVWALPTGTLTEVWSGPGGAALITARRGAKRVVSAAGGSITMPGFAWFAPALLLARARAAGWGATDHGRAAHDGATAEHAAVWPQPAVGTPGALPWMMLRQQRRADFYMDPDTHLPRAAVFRVRPYTPPGQRPPPRLQLASEEVRYTQYQNMGGVMLPTRLELRLQARPIIEITITQARINTGAVIAPPQ